MTTNLPTVAMTTSTARNANIDPTMTMKAITIIMKRRAIISMGTITIITMGTAMAMVMVMTITTTVGRLGAMS